MKFTVVIPSTLKKYTGAATDRESKIIRAVNSVLKQTFKDFEIIIVSDGCDKTVEIITENFNGFLVNKKIRLYKIKKQKTWSGQPRNTGIKFAEGEWIVYLDIDDLFSETHLEKINKGIKENPTMDWLFFHDFSYDVKRKLFVEHFIRINVKGQCGTSNIAHKKSLNARWPVHGNNQHDWIFINNLKKVSKNFCHIETPGYCICHVPGLLDV